MRRVDECCRHCECNECRQKCRPVCGCRDCRDDNYWIRVIRDCCSRRHEGDRNRC